MCNLKFYSMIKLRMCAVLSLFALGVTSCNDDIESNNSLSANAFSKNVVQNDLVEEDSEVFTYTLIYKDNVYKSLCELRNDSLFLLDKDVQEVQNKIFANENSVSFVRNDSVVEYFDCQDDFLNKYEIRDLEAKDVQTLRQSMTRGIHPNSLAYSVMYEDKNFKGRIFEMDVTSDLMDNSQQFARLKDYGFNDKASSIKVQYTYDIANFCAVLTVWADTNFKGHRTNFIATYNNKNTEFSNLKKIFCKNSPLNWGDRISSCFFRLLLLGSEPEEL